MSPRPPREASPPPFYTICWARGYDFLTIHLRHSRQRRRLGTRRTHTVIWQSSQDQVDPLLGAVAVCLRGGQLGALTGLQAGGPPNTCASAFSAGSARALSRSRIRPLSAFGEMDYDRPQPSRISAAALTSVHIRPCAFHLYITSMS
jgi:hypothetical protein